MSLPRLLFVSGDTTRIEEYFHLSAVLPWVRAMQLHFEVIELLEAHQLEREVARSQPDLILFFGAKYKLLFDGEVKDYRIATGVPVVALTLMDAHSPAKQAFFEHAWRLGVEAVFTIDTGMREMCGEFADAVFYCPWFINEEMSRDFGEEKIIPIALIGDGFVSTDDDWRYPWRREVAERLRKEFVVFSSPRPTKVYPHRMVGEAYGRMLNRSRMALSCGASRHIFMKKNLEIPAARSCLVTEPNETLRHLGFIDMENCVFATPQDVVEKCRMLLNEPDALEQITERGFTMVHRLHTGANRRMIADWLQLRKLLKPGQRIVQTGILDPLRIQTEPHRLLLGGESPFVHALQASWRALETGEHQAALSQSHAAGRMLPFTPEPGIVSALAAVHAGEHMQAATLIAQLLRRSFFWESECPDPVLWSVYLACLGCGGHVDEMRVAMASFPQLQTPVLNALSSLVGEPVREAAELQLPSVFYWPSAYTDPTSTFWRKIFSIIESRPHP